MFTTITDRTQQIATRLFEQQREYEAEAREAADAGLRPHYCIHGTNLWTDYDNICGGCEDGEFTQYSTAEQVREYARALAEAEAAREARQAEQVTNLVNLTIEGYRAKGRLIGTPRIYRDGAAAVLILETSAYTLAVEIDANGQATHRTLS